jgi:hypothetical protein
MISRRPRASSAGDIGAGQRRHPPAATAGQAAVWAIVKIDTKSPLLMGSKKAQVYDLGFAPPLGLEPRTLRLTAECSAS